MKRLNIELTEIMYAELAELAEEKHLSVTKVIRDAITARLIMAQYDSVFVKKSNGEEKEIIFL